MSKTFRHFVDREFVSSASGKTFEKRRPSDGKVIGTIAEAGAAEVDGAVGAARAALAVPWGKMSLEQRTALLDCVADEIHRRCDDFVDAEMNDTGQPRSLVAHGFVPRGQPISGSSPTS